MKRYKVIHFGTGYTGSDALRQIIDRPDLELVGMLVHTPAKEGKDAGELCGRPPTGVLATRDINRLLALDADCVSYFATEWGRPFGDTIEQMARFLESGKCLTTTTYPVLVYPKAAKPEFQARLTDACRKGNSSFFGTGIQPGYTGDVLPATLSSMCESIEAIHIQDRTNIGAYPDPLSFAGIGFGRTPEEDARDYKPGFLLEWFAGTFGLLEEALNIKFDELREVRKTAIAKRDYHFDAGPVLKGQIVSVYLECQGIIDGKPRVTNSVVYNMSDENVDDFPPQLPPNHKPKRNTRIIIEGSPPMTVNIAMGLDEAAMHPGCIATAARAVNAIPFLCEAAPGVVYDGNSLTPISGRNIFRLG